MPALDDLIACPHCDTLHRLAEMPDGAIARCSRCHAILLTARPEAVARIVSLALTGFILMVVAVSFPFLDLDLQGRHNATSVLSAILAFDGLALPLAFAVALFILVLPLLRLGALIYALAPLAVGARPFAQARRAFALAEGLRPWAMAEIFMVGVSVALVKVAGLANVTPGPAFWAFGCLVVVMVLKDQLINRYAIWQALDTA